MAARKITVGFGLMSIPGRMDGAVEQEEALPNLCKGQPGHDEHDPKPLKAPRVCEKCGPIVENSVLVKGRKSGSTYTIVEQEPIKEAREEFTRAYLDKIDLVPHPAGPFLAATAPGDKTYYITPEDAGGADHYQLLVRLIEAHPELVFVGLHAMKSASPRTHLWLMQVRDGVLVMQKRVREQALKAAPSVGGTVNEALYAVLDATLDQFVVDYDPETYEDGYALAVAKMIEEGEQVTVDEAKATAAPVKMSDDELIEKLAKLRSVA